MRDLRYSYVNIPLSVQNLEWRMKGKEQNGTYDEASRDATRQLAVRWGRGEGG